MSLHRLTAGAGYKYLIRHTACGDVHRAASRSLTAYYIESGYPPGRWTGTGLKGLDDERGIAAGTTVSEEGMARLFGAGRDPVTDAPLGRAHPVFRSLEQRIDDRVAALPASLPSEDRQTLAEQITVEEAARRSRSAVAGFDLTFTVPKSASVLWALGEPAVQDAVVDAHRHAVADVVAFLEDRALFTRTGTHSVAQVATRGAVAAGFEHWDTRSGDPNLHTHLVLANKVQGLDGRWRALDSRALYTAAVAVSELYDDLIADHLAARLPVTWAWRERGPRRSPAYEVDGISDRLLECFSTRAAVITEAVRTTLTDFTDTHGREPSRAEVLRIRQRVTRASRPAKTVQNLPDQLTAWRRRACAVTGRQPHQIVAEVLDSDPVTPLTVEHVSPDMVDRLAGETTARLMERRSTWTTWNVQAETARTCRGLRLADPAHRRSLHDTVVDRVLAGSVRLEAPDLFTVPPTYRRPDGTAVFTRSGEDRYSGTEILNAEQRLLTAHHDLTAPATPLDPATALDPAAAGSWLGPDQVDAVTTIASSRSRIDVLVGPAGSGKTRTLLALRKAWEAEHGPGSVIGLAPSATAARELGDALGVPCENTAKWIHESTGPGARRRTASPRLRSGAEQERWGLRPGQVVIVDEASMAGTLVLDELRAQAVAAGAKLLLVGDHRQLSAVEAGGAFRLLAETGRPVELRGLWRFRNRWEAEATRRLRVGDPACLDAYDAHGRLHDGPFETMLDAAYTAARTAETDGRTTILLAPDTATVEALNARARTERIAAGHVTHDGVPACGGVVIGVGDRVVTRLNDRRLPFPAPGGDDFVRNGTLWQVVGVHADGSITARILPPDHTRHDQAAPEVRLPAAYTRQNVELGYASTLHRAEGITVDTGHLIASPATTREAFTVGMTRGRAENHVYLAVDVPDPTGDQIPDVDVGREARDVYEDILARTGSELSATQTIHRAHDEAASLARLHPIAATIASDAHHRRWTRLLATSCGLTARQAGQITDSPAVGPLVAALRTGERAGYDMTAILRGLAADLDDGVEDPAAVLHHRVRAWLRKQDGDGPHYPAGAALVQTLLPDLDALPHDDEAWPVLNELDQLIRARLHALSDPADTDRPAWLRPLQRRPDGPDADGDGLDDPAAAGHAAHAAVAGYRDLTGNPDSPHRGRPVLDETDRRQQRLASAALRDLRRAPAAGDVRTPQP